MPFNLYSNCGIDFVLCSKLEKQDMVDRITTEENGKGIEVDDVLSTR